MDIIIHNYCTMKMSIFFFERTVVNTVVTMLCSIAQKKNIIFTWLLKTPKLMPLSITCYRQMRLSINAWGLCNHKKFSSYICVFTVYTHCLRIDRNSNFIYWDFFHFTSVIHNGDNLNMKENLRFHVNTYIFTKMSD